MNPDSLEFEPIDKNVVLPNLVDEPEALLKLRLKVTNNSDADLQGVRPMLPCSCDLTYPLPEVFTARSSAEIEFRIRAPFAGIQKRDIVFHDDQNRQVGQLQLLVRAEGVVPRIDSPKDAVRASYIFGEDGNRQFEIRTVERAGEPPWIRTIDSSNTDVMEVVGVNISDTVSIDRDFVQRKYLVQFELNFREVGKKKAILNIAMNSNQILERLIEVDVRDRALMMPSQLIIRTDRGAGARQAKFLVVPRVSGDTFSIQKFDEKLISIEKLSNDAGCEWKASVQDEVKNRIETEIVMVSSSGYQIVFPLTIE